MSHDHSNLFPEVMPAEPEKATLEGKNKFFGLWFFLGGETVLFGSLFGTYLALKNSTAGGPSSDEIFGLGLVFLMTMLLLTSSLTSVYAMYHMRNNDFKKMILRSEEHTSELQSRGHLVCRLLLEKKKKERTEGE